MRTKIIIYLPCIFTIAFSLNGFAMKRNLEEQQGFKSHGSEIQPAPDSYKCCLYFDVEMDEIIVVSSSKEPRIGSYGISTCVAVCARGNTDKNEEFFGFCHASIALGAEYVFKEIKEKLIKCGCKEHSIEFFVAGTYPKSTLMINDYETFRKDYGQDYNIKEMRLCICKGDNDKESDYYVKPRDRIAVEDGGLYGELTIVLTKEGIFYSLNPEFSVFKPKD